MGCFDDLIDTTEIRRKVREVEGQLKRGKWGPVQKEVQSLVSKKLGIDVSGVIEFPL